MLQPGEQANADTVRDWHVPIAIRAGMDQRGRPSQYSYDVLEKKILGTTVVDDGLVDQAGAFLLSRDRFQVDL